MRAVRVAALASWLFAGGVATAAVPMPKQVMTTPRSPVATAAELVVPPAGARTYDLVVYEGGKQLHMAPSFIDLCRKGLGLLYGRAYRDTRAYFVELEELFPGTAVSAIADLLVWQAVMLENFDFRHDAQYQAASALAATKLEAALLEPGNEGWEHFMLAGVRGVAAIHDARQSRYLGALRLAFEAIDHVESVRKHAPTFVDLALADGLYNYWRTVITQRAKGLPDFGDRRQEGIVQVQSVETKGIFLAPPATLAMAFTWIEEEDFDKALEACERNRALYPDNLINEQMRGVVHLYRRKYSDALAAFDHVLAIDPKNKRAHYYRGMAFLRAGNSGEAQRAFETYLAFDYMEDYQRATAHYRLGQVFYREKRYADAEAQYLKAVGINGDDAAKRALDELRQERKAGTISW
jgi:tetratricopeptide (TPR) repeat protein